MSRVGKSIIKGLEEAIQDAKSEKKTLKRNTVVIEPVKEYKAQEVKRIRNNIGFSQGLFADYIGVSKKTVEAWESGTNKPSGAASRLLSMMEIDNMLIYKYPFIKQHK